MKRKDLRDGMKVAFVSKAWRKNCGPYGEATIHGDPLLSWVGNFPNPPKRVGGGPGILALNIDGNKIVLNQRDIVGPFEETLEKLKKRDDELFSKIGIHPDDPPEVKEEKARKAVESIFVKDGGVQKK